MKKLVTLLALVATYSAYSQGTVNFNNWVGLNIQAPVTYAAGGPVVAGQRASSASPQVADGAFTYGGQFAQAALYGAPGAGRAEADLVIIVPAVGFRTDIAGAVNTGTSATRAVQGADAGKPATLQVRAWDAGEILADNSYEGALAATATRGVYAGKSALLAIASLGGTPTDGSPPITAPNLTGLGKVAIPMTFYAVPEPSIIGLGILGAVAGLMVFRRRS